MRGLLLFLGWVLLGPCADSAAQDPAAPSDDRLQELLEALVDAPSKTRAARADALAARTDVSLERWLQAAASFGRFARAPTGLSRETAVLDDGRKTTLTIYVPTSYDPAKRCGLLMGFHGAGADGRWLVAGWRALAQRSGLVIVAPHEPLAAQGYTASQAERDGAWAALRWARRRFNVDENRILAVGYSRGAHLVWDLALRRPDRFAAVGAVVGGPRITLANNQNNLRFVEHLVSVPLMCVQGAKDDPRLLQNVRMAFQRLRKLGAKRATLVEQPDRGHNADWTAVDWSDWLSSRRDAEPARVVRMAVQGGAGRAAWVEALDVSERAPAQFAIRVPASRAAGMREDKMRDLFQKEADKRTARLEARRLGPGKFSLRAKFVGGARLLLTDAARGDLKAMQVNWRGRQMRKPAEPSARVLLREFAERFDRTFLPTAEVRVP